MTSANTVLTKIFDLLLGLSPINPWLGMLVISLITSVVLLLIFRFTSNQPKVLILKKRMISHLLEIFLYRDYPRTIIRAQTSVFATTFIYLLYMLIPIAAMLIPASIFMIQLDLRYGHRPLHIGEHAIVSATVDPNKTDLDDISLTATDGVAIETASLRLPDEGKVEWRVAAQINGNHQLQIQANQATITKEILVGTQHTPIATTRVAKGIWAQYLHPGEAPLQADSPITAISINYPAANLPLHTWHFHWLWPWLILSMLFGLMLKKVLRVNM